VAVQGHWSVIVARRDFAFEIDTPRRTGPLLAAAIEVAR
jgi:hypothetical protein